jgi:cell division protein FtsB
MRYLFCTFVENIFMKQVEQLTKKAQGIWKHAKGVAQVAKSRLNKYWVAVGVFLLLFLFFNENTLFKRIAYDRQIKQLESEITFYTAEKKANQTKLKVLNSDKETLEKIAREQYKMVKPDEELFIINE